MIKSRKYCPACGSSLIIKEEDGIPRDHCDKCDTYFYDNPLPVAANIVMKDRKILLVKRKKPPFAGLWCLPMGFAESGESIETVALRELSEETGITGKIINLVHVESGRSDTYGDLLHLSFESEWTSGELMAGDDASALNFFPFDNLPDMAFRSNINAIKKYISVKQDYWAILDSFQRSAGMDTKGHDIGAFLSDDLVRMIEKNAEVITNRWLADVQSSKTTPTYAKCDPETCFSRNKEVIRQLGKWLGGAYGDKDIKKLYWQLGKDRKEEGFALSEVLSALSLNRKHIWEFALSQGIWDKPIDIYMAIELERRVMLFFDKAAYHLTRGYEG